MDFLYRKAPKTSLSRASAPCQWGLMWGAALWTVMATGLWSCGDAPTALEPVQGHAPTLTGVEFAQFFGFSADRDTLWLLDGQGIWTPWNFEAAGDVPPKGNSLAKRPLKLPLAPKIATWSTTHVPHIQALQASNKWVGTGYKGRVSIQESERPGDLDLPFDLGGDGGLDEESLVASGAQVLTSYPFGDPMQGVEDRTGVKVMPLREYEEAHPLARAEYIKVFGWLLGQREEADAVFRDIASRYSAARNKGQLLAAAFGRPVVFTGSEQGGLWTAPTFDGLVARLIEDAGGEYLLGQKTEQSMGLRRVGSNIEMELEQFAVLAADADAWGKVVYAPEGWYREDAEAALPWFNLGGKLLFHCNTAEVDYFGQAVLEPDVMLADLVGLLHDQGSHSEGQRYFQRTQDRP